MAAFRRKSINRVLATALIKLAPEDLEFAEIPIGGLPLYIRLWRRLPRGGPGAQGRDRLGVPATGIPGGGSSRNVYRLALPTPGYGTPTVRENSMTAEKEPEVKAVLARRQEFDTDLHPAGSP